MSERTLREIALDVLPRVSCHCGHLRRVQTNHSPSCLYFELQQAALTTPAAAAEPHAWVPPSEVELFALLPGPYYMDPPDGGDVSLLEQLRCMSEDAAKWRSAAAAKPVAQVVAVYPPGPDGHGVNWLHGKHPKPGTLLYALALRTGDKP